MVTPPPSTTKSPGQHPVDWRGATHTSPLPGESRRWRNPYHPASRGIHHNSWGSCCWCSEAKLPLCVYLLGTPRTTGGWLTDTTCHPLLVALPGLRLTPSGKLLYWMYCRVFWFWWTCAGATWGHPNFVPWTSRLWLGALYNKLLACMGMWRVPQDVIHSSAVHKSKMKYM